MFPTILVAKHIAENIPLKLKKNINKYTYCNITDFLVKALVVGLQYLVVVTNLITQDPQKYNEEITTDVVIIYFWLVRLCLSVCTCEKFIENISTLYTITNTVDNFFKIAPVKLINTDDEVIISLFALIDLMVNNKFIFKNKIYGVYIAHVLYFVDSRVNYENNKFASKLKYVWTQIALLDFKQVDMTVFIEIMKQSKSTLAKFQLAHLVLPDILKKPIIYSRLDENEMSEFMAAIAISRNTDLSTFYDVIKVSYLDLFKQKGPLFWKSCLNITKVPVPNNDPIVSATQYVKECPICFDDLTQSNACLLSCVPLPSESTTWTTCPHMVCSSCWQSMSSRLCPLCRRVCTRV